MVRTIIQLDEEQHARLRRLAAEKHLSVAELVRRGVDLYIKGEKGTGSEDRKQRAMDAAGRFSSGDADTAGKHDEHLAEIYGRKAR